MIVLGLDPGLRFTGWGVVESSKGECLGYGVISTASCSSVPERLAFIFKELQNILRTYSVDDVVLEEVFINSNGQSSIKLCMARGISMVVPALYGKKVFEYAANFIKKTITGCGHASKEEIQRMVHILLPKIKSFETADSADALAAALCHIQSIALRVA